MSAEPLQDSDDDGGGGDDDEPLENHLNWKFAVQVDVVLVMKHDSRYFLLPLNEFFYLLLTINE